MTITRRIELALLTIATALVVVAVLALVWPPRVNEGSDLPLGAIAMRPAAAVPATLAPSAGETVVQSNIFSPTRTPPVRRYVPGVEETEPDPNTAAPMTASPDTSAAAMDAAIPALFGTMVSPDGGSALLHLDPSSSEPRLYRVGDSAGGYRVLKIEERAVTLVGRSGRVVLRLKKEEK